MLSNKINIVDILSDTLYLVKLIHLGLKQALQTDRERTICCDIVIKSCREIFIL